jgi:hypothetical protein
MSTPSFDDLARTLAEPMPRRRALRFAGASLVTALTAGLGARRASASPCGPDTPCSSICTSGNYIGACGTDTTNSCGQIGCRLEGCLSPGEKCCRGGDAPWICNDDERCGSVGGPHCIACPEERKCGKACCKSGEFCGSKNRELCCKRGENVCVVPNSSQGVCCPPGKNCCFNKDRAECCGPDQTCKRGKCVCNQGETCGESCCKKGETCSKGKCCPKGEVNCGDGECCKKAASCCGKTCCTGSRETCVGGAGGPQCCLRSRIFGAGKSRRCCPSGTVATATGCCPPTNLSCCDANASSLVTCLGQHDVCVRNVCTQL